MGVILDFGLDLDWVWVVCGFGLLVYGVLAVDGFGVYFDLGFGLAWVLWDCVCCLVLWDCFCCLKLLFVFCTYIALHYYFDLLLWVCF